MAQLNFDATNVAPAAGPAALIPPGIYNAQIVTSEMKPNSSGTGTLLLFTFQIMDGEYQGFTVLERVNWTNPSAQAVEIARRTVSSIGHAVGILQIADSQQLHGIPLQIRVAIEKGGPKDDGTSWPDKSKIVDYLKAGTAQAGAQPEVATAPVQQAAQPPQNQAVSNRPPWATN